MEIGPGAQPVDWAAGQWLHRPVRVEPAPDAGLFVEPAADSDLWRHTGYGFVHDDAPALLAPFATGSAVEVGFRLDYTGQFDQAGVLARVDGEPWRLVRLAPLAPEAVTVAGPYCCSPTRGGLTVRFTGWRHGPADAALHP